MPTTTLPGVSIVETPALIPLLSPRYVLLQRFGELTGYTVDAINAKIKRGQWLQGELWVKAPDGRILIDLIGYTEWAAGNPA